MLVADITSCGDAQMDEELLLAELSARKFSSAIVFSDRKPFSVAPSISTKIYWVKSYHHSRVQDIFAVVACLAFRGKLDTSAAIRITEKLDVHEYPFEYLAAGLSLFAETSYSYAGSRQSLTLLRATRAWAQQGLSEYAAPVAEELRLFIILLELKISFYSHPRSEKIAELADLKNLADWKTFIAELINHTRKISAANKSLEKQIAPQLEFLSIGEQLCKRCLGDVYAKRWCHFFSWLAAYFLGMAAFCLADGSYAASVCCSVRALDCCLTLWSLNMGTMTIDERYGLKMTSGGSPEGIFKIWDSVLDNIKNHIPVEMKDIIHRVNDTIFVRNKIVLTHGVQHPSQSVAKECLQCVEDFAYLIGRLTKDPQRVVHGLISLQGQASQAAKPEDFAGRAFDRIVDTLN